MGLAMASNLQKHLHSQGHPPLRIWNRTTSKGEHITNLGGIQCETIAELISQCGIIFISVLAICILNLLKFLIKFFS